MNVRKKQVGVKKYLNEAIDKQMKSLVDQLGMIDNQSPDNENYERVVKQLGLLDDFKKKFNSKKEWIDWKVWAPVIGSGLTVLLITQHERVDVITTKALSFIPKGRV